MNNTTIKKGLTIVGIALLAACHTTKKTAKTAAPTNEVAYSAAEMAKDKATWQVKCKTCHELKEPSSVSAKRWPKVVAEMAEKASGHPEIAISAADQAAISRYLQAMASK